MVIPDVLNPSEVQKLREFFRPLFEHQGYKDVSSSDSEKILTDIYAKYQNIQWLLFHEPTNSILRSLVGDDLVILRESCVHLNRFGGWHKDTTSIELSGCNFHLHPNFLLVHTAFYLQDNTPEYGGGLDVEPASHREPDPFVGIKGDPPFWKRPFIKKCRENTYFKPNGAQYVSNPQTVWSKAGDLVIFNFRITHQATQPLEPDTPNTLDKLVVFSSYCANNMHLANYMRYIENRPDPNGVWDYLKEPYSTDLLNQAARSKVTLYQ